MTCPELDAPALLVAGPTCSGKSALALLLALRLRGTVINADSMQVYRELRVLTARPGPDDEAAVPHRLYGVRPAAEPGSVAWWRGEALAAMAEARADGRVPVLCGGTGLYFAALRDGLAPVPEPGEAARAEARTLLERLGAAGLHARLASADPRTAAELRPTDGQRLARAWEVWCGTGRGLSEWREVGAEGAAPFRFAALLLDPPREALREAIARRFDAMLAAGAVDEVRALLAQDLPATLPAMRAHGVPELLAHLRGELTLVAARERAVAATRRYVKRQSTWFRHHRLAALNHTHMIHARFDDPEQLSQRTWAEIESFVHCRVDVPGMAP